MPLDAGKLDWVNRMLSTDHQNYTDRWSNWPKDRVNNLLSLWLYCHNNINKDAFPLLDGKAPIQLYKKNPTDDEKTNWLAQFLIIENSIKKLVKDSNDEDYSPEIQAKSSNSESGYTSEADESMDESKQYNSIKEIVLAVVGEGAISQEDPLMKVYLKNDSETGFLNEDEILSAIESDLRFQAHIDKASMQDFITQRRNQMSQNLPQERDNNVSSASDIVSLDDSERLILDLLLVKNLIENAKKENITADVRLNLLTEVISLLNRYQQVFASSELEKQRVEIQQEIDQIIPDNPMFDTNNAHEEYDNPGDICLALVEYGRNEKLEDDANKLQAAYNDWDQLNGDDASTAEEEIALCNSVIKFLDIIEQNACFNAHPDSEKMGVKLGEIRAEISKEISSHYSETMQMARLVSQEPYLARTMAAALSYNEFLDNRSGLSKLFSRHGTTGKENAGKFQDEILKIAKGNLSADEKSVEYLRAIYTCVQSSNMHKNSFATYLVNELKEKKIIDLPNCDDKTGKYNQKSVLANINVAIREKSSQAASEERQQSLH